MSLNKPFLKKNIYRLVGLQVFAVTVQFLFL